MKNRAFAVPFASPPLTPDLKVPLYRQLYERIRQAILSGNLGPGSKLPSTRALAQQLGTARNTVLNAFEQLLAEGYLTGRLGSGTYVSQFLPDHLPHTTATPSRGSETDRPAPAPSFRGAALTEIPTCLSHRQEVVCAFRHGLPAVDEFPFDLWARLTARIWRSKPRGLLNYGEPAGYRPLREAIAAYLGTSRGVKCHPDQVIVVSGSQQALDLAARVLLDAGDGVWIEDPGYIGARGAFLAAGVQLHPVPVDSEGFRLPSIPDSKARVRMVYVTPAHQYPLGMTMSMARRLALLEWAKQANGWILEDDYDSEYRYSGRPLAALQGIDPNGRVIYVGTFSKVLFPSLRIGYLVVPGTLVNAFVCARILTDGHTSTLSQAVVAEFLEAGHFARHVRKMRLHYADRQEVLVRAASRTLKGIVEVSPSEAGMHLVGRFDDGIDDRQRARQAAAHGITVTPLSSLALSPQKPRGVLLGYTAFDAHSLMGGVKALAAAWRGKL
jgi:GntR family transcriptional regulator/MocR family aminotransferase